MTIRVLLADDQTMVRSGFRQILETQPGPTVVAEAGDGAQAVALAQESRPDLALVDIRMPELDGIEVTRAIAGPDVPDPLRVVIVTTFDTDEYVYGALRAGAIGVPPQGRWPCPPHRSRAVPHADSVGCSLREDFLVNNNRTITGAQQAPEARNTPALIGRSIIVSATLIREVMR